MSEDGREKLLRSTHNQHKVAFSKQALDVIRVSDIILETLDARYISKSRIPEMEKSITSQGKMLIHVIMKADLIKREERADTSELSHPVFISSKTKEGVGSLRERIHILAKKFKEHPKVHVGVIGYPNTGKSALISLLARRAAAPKSPHSGFTKGIRRIRFAKDILLLDTPGVIPTSENLFGHDIRKHALMGVHTPENVKNPDIIVAEIMKLNPGKIEKYYDIQANGDVEILLDELGKKWKLLKKKAEIDTDKVARRVLRDWHEGKINQSKAL